jgi:hypothetical protein
MFAQAATEAFCAVVGTGRTVAVGQVLVDGHVVALETQLGFDGFPRGPPVEVVNLAAAGGRGGGI